MKTIVYANMLPFIALVVLLFLIHKNPLFHRQQNRLFQVAVVVTMVMLVAISADYLFSMGEFSSAWMFRRITSFLNFAMSPVVPLMLYKIFARQKQSSWLYLPCAINMVLCAISLGPKLVFSISSENTYGRGPLFFVPFTISVAYMVVLLFGSGAERQGGKRSERIFLAVVICTLGLGMYLEIVQRFKFISWDIAAVSLVLYYLLLNINNATTDPLTGAFNRPMYTTALAKAGIADGCMIALIDINEFKLINDQQGHAAGDQCLQLFVELMQQSLPKGATFYRIGGDEFAVLSRRHDQPGMVELMEKARRATLKHSIDFSYGLAYYNPDTDLEQVLRIADQAMYVQKRQLKAQQKTP